MTMAASCITGRRPSLGMGSRPLYRSREAPILVNATASRLQTHSRLTNYTNATDPAVFSLYLFALLLKNSLDNDKVCVLNTGLVTTRPVTTTRKPPTGVVTGGGSCVDKRGDCSVLKISDWCSKNREWMGNWCPSTCNFCTGSGGGTGGSSSGIRFFSIVMVVSTRQQA